MLLWSDLCAGGDRDEEAEKRSLQVQIPNAQKRNQGLFVQIQIHYASAIQELFKKHKYKYLMLRNGIKVCSVEIQIQIHYMQV